MALKAVGIPRFCAVIVVMAALPARTFVEFGFADVFMWHGLNRRELLWCRKELGYFDVEGSGPVLNPQRCVWLASELVTPVVVICRKRFVVRPVSSPRDGTFGVDGDRVVVLPGLGVEGALDRHGVRLQVGRNEFGGLDFLRSAVLRLVSKLAIVRL